MLRQRDKGACASVIVSFLLHTASKKSHSQSFVENIRTLFHWPNDCGVHFRVAGTDSQGSQTLFPALGHFIHLENLKLARTLHFVRWGELQVWINESFALKDQARKQKVYLYI